MVQITRVRARSSRLNRSSTERRTFSSGAMVTLAGSTSGAMWARLAATPLCPGRRATRKRSDSGRANQSTTHRPRVATAPTMNRPRHPIAAIAGGAVKPATTAPRATLQNIRVTSQARRRSGMKSAVRAAAIGWAEPMPIPVISRQTMNSVRLWEKAAARVEMPARAMPRSISGRRPNRSASGATKAPPRPMPASDAVSTQPKSAGRIFQASATAGTASDMIWMS